MNKLTVFVTGLGGGGHGEQIFKALRMAGTGYRIIGGDMNRHSKGLANADKAYVLPPARDPDYIDRVLEICAENEVRALFHGSEPELKAMAANREKIESRGIFLPINPSRVIETCMDKVRTFDLLSSKGFVVPRFAKVSSLGELADFDLLPAVLKPSVGSGGSANTFIAQTEQELHCFGNHLLSLYPEFIVQEYVGTPDGEYTVGVLTSMDGDFLNSIAVKRNILTALSNRLKIPNKMNRPELGEILAISNGVSQGEIGPFPEVTRRCEEIAAAVGARGPANVQCRLVDGEVYVFEINPRFSGTSSFRAMVGFNEPDILIRKHVLGEHIEPRFSYKTGVILRGLSETFIEADH